MDIEEKKEIIENPGEAIDALLSDTPPAQPATPDPSKTETPSAEPVKEAAATVPTVKEGEEKPAETAKVEEPQQNKLFAGKYTNTFDLIEGVLEEVKVLKGDKKEIATLVTEAQASGDWSKVESKYKELQSQVVKQIQEAKKTEEKKSPEKPLEKETSVTDDLNPEEFQKLLTDTTMKQISTSDLAKKFEKFGAEIPTTQEALDNLEIAYPTLWSQFVETFKSLYSANKGQAEAYLKAEKDAPIHNESQIKLTKQSIEDFAKEWQIELPAEKIDEFIAEAQNNALVFEDKNGVKFVRDGAMFDWFMAKHAREILNQVREKTKVESLNQGRKEAVQDLATNRGKVPQTMSTSSVPQTPATKVPEIDWNNPDDARKVGRDALQDKLNQLLNS